MRYEDKRFLHPREADFGQMKKLPLSGELARECETEGVFYRNSFRHRLRQCHLPQ